MKADVGVSLGSVEPPAESFVPLCSVALSASWRQRAVELRGGRRLHDFRESSDPFLQPLNKKIHTDCDRSDRYIFVVVTC